MMLYNYITTYKCTHSSYVYYDVIVTGVHTYVSVRVASAHVCVCLCGMVCVCSLTSSLNILMSPEFTFVHSATPLMFHSVLECSANGPVLT